MNTCVCGILEHVWHFCFVYNMIINFFLNRMIKNLKKVFLSNNQSQSYIIFKIIINFIDYMWCLEKSLVPRMWSALTITLRSHLLGSLRLDKETTRDIETWEWRSRNDTRSWATHGRGSQSLKIWSEKFLGSFIILLVKEQIP